MRRAAECGEASSPRWRCGRGGLEPPTSFRPLDLNPKTGLCTITHLPRFPPSLAARRETPTPTRAVIDGYARTLRHGVRAVGHRRLVGLLLRR